MLRPSFASSPVASLTRRDALRRAGLWLGGALVASRLSPHLSAQDSALPVVEDPNVTTMRRGLGEAPFEHVALTDRIHAFIGQGSGNIGVLVTDDGLLVVDSGAALPPATERLAKALADLSAQPVRYLVNTHWHFDHTDGNRNLHQLGATIVAHHTVRSRLNQPGAVAFLNLRFGASPRQALPTLLVREGLDLHLGGERAELRHIPAAHTDGDVCVYWPEQDVLQTGDLFFSGAYPFIDGGSGGSVAGMIRAGEQLLQVAKDTTQLIPGHGPVSRRSDLEASLEMLRTVQSRIGRLRARGVAVEDAVAQHPLADLDAKWGAGFINGDTFVRLVYSLAE